MARKLRRDAPARVWKILNGEAQFWRKLINKRSNHIPMRLWTVATYDRLSNY
jgi:hypothetical protein